MPVTKKAAPSELSRAAEMFLLGYGADPADYEGLDDVFVWNELAILSAPGREDETQGKLPGTSGLSARQLVQKYGRKYLDIVEREHGPANGRHGSTD